jgi:hypothetical protein
MLLWRWGTAAAVALRRPLLLLLHASTAAVRLLLLLLLLWLELLRGRGSELSLLNDVGQQLRSSEVVQERCEYQYAATAAGSDSYASAGLQF